MLDQIKAASTKMLGRNGRRPKVLVLFGTRPEAIKMAPVIRELKARSVHAVVVSSSQHKQLLAPFLRSLHIDIDVDLSVMKRGQTPNDVCSRVIGKLDKVIERNRPDVILVQGDTTTTLAGALAGFNQCVPVAHIEAGLRTGDAMSPFPEEMNRRLVSRLAAMHFAATEGNRCNLLSEGIPADRIFVTGNPVVDSLKQMLAEMRPSAAVKRLIQNTSGLKRILLTTHRRESFGEILEENLRALRDFAASKSDVAVLFPVHPNPNVKRMAERLLGGRDRVHLLDPLDYSDFLSLMQASWLIVSDSGGVQEEAPSIGKPLLVIRENTERPEAIDAGVAKLVGKGKHALDELLEANYYDDSWIRSIARLPNPFGDGHAAKRIVSKIAEKLAAA